MPSSNSSSSSSTSYRWWRAMSKVRRRAELKELNQMRSIVVEEIGELEDRRLAATAKLRTLDTLAQEVMESIEEAEQDDRAFEDEYGGLQNLTLDEKDAYIAHLEGRFDVAPSLSEQQEKEVSSADAALLYHVKVSNYLRDLEARRHARAVALAVSAEQRQGERLKEMALRRQRQELESMANVGLSIRNRVLEYAFVEDGVSIRESVVAKGNRSAHDGDVLADVRLYADAAEPKRNDPARFQTYYGASVQTVKGMKHFATFIEMLNWHYDMKTIMAERNFDKKDVDMEAFLKGFRFIMRLMAPIGEISADWELEENTEPTKEYSNLMNIHGRASFSHQA